MASALTTPSPSLPSTTCTPSTAPLRTTSMGMPTTTLTSTPTLTPTPPTPRSFVLEPNTELSRLCSLEISSSPKWRNMSDESLALLTRLSQKPGVQSTLILSRENGTSIRTSGLILNSSLAPLVSRFDVPQPRLRLTTAPTARRLAALVGLNCICHVLYN
ncbi:hypothetical protein NX059_012456 [Plenodomus lindquistii]|nr:hypothetical protein NX059_012456 [Plenodomus lindquistii]